MTQFELGRGKALHRDVEALLGEISDSKGPDSFRVPTRLPGREFGRAATFLQAVATWSDRYPSASLRSYTRGSDELRSLVEADQGLVAVLLAEAIADRDGADISWDAHRLVRERLPQLQEFSTARRGKKVMIVAADATSWSSPSALYATHGPSGGIVQTDAGFTVLARKFLELGARKQDLPRLYRAAHTIGKMLSEVVRNTHEHARLESDDLTRVRRSVRFVRAEGVFEPLETLLDHVAGDDALDRFVRSTSRGDRARYLEITIWDSGPGLAARRLRDLGLPDPTFEQEWSASVDCFEKHLTTSGNGARGKGLDAVQVLLTELNGMLRMRTGRVRLERDYAAHPHESGRRTDFGIGPELPRTRGTSLTILIPTHLEGV